MVDFEENDFFEKRVNGKTTEDYIMDLQDNGVAKVTGARISYKEIDFLGTAILKIATRVAPKLILNVINFQKKPDSYIEKYKGMRKI